MKILYNRLVSLFERNKRNLDRCDLLSARLQTALERVASYRNNAPKRKKDKIDFFIAEIVASDKRLQILIERARGRIDQIEKSISKSNPDIGLDPQMEPLITTFVENVENIFNGYNDNLADVKEFESEIVDVEAVPQMLVSTDSLIRSVDKISTEKNKIIVKAKKTQKRAHEEFDKGLIKNAAKLTNDAYYLLFQLAEDASEVKNNVDHQYSQLIEELINIEADIEADELKSLFYSLAEEHTKKAYQFLQDGNIMMSQKEIDLSNILLLKIYNCKDCEKVEKGKL